MLNERRENTSLPQKHIKSERQAEKQIKKRKKAWRGDRLFQVSADLLVSYHSPFSDGEVHLIF